jgi:hypothetical protein
MPGGLMQIVNKGAQDHLVTGSPSFTHFRSMYKRHTEFAMEHFVLNFRGTNLNLHPQMTRSFRAKVDRNAQLLHDCYIRLQLPDIYSPVSPNGDGTASPYNFQWIPNIGYNMIRSVSLLINGTAIVTHTGEWMKLYSYLTHDSNKRKTIDEMVGNVPELIDPGNAYGRFNQYPHAITSSKTVASPSIPAREIVIPLHFWFCENIGTALPLVALQYSEVEIVVEFNNIYSLFTVNDVRPASPTYNSRIAPDINDALFAMNKFLAPPNVDTTTSNVSLMNWVLQPYIEANYIFVSDAEMVHLAKNDNSFIFKEVNIVVRDGVYDAGNDIPLTLTNLCTRIAWVGQRSDVSNDPDNYIDSVGVSFANFGSVVTPWYSSNTIPNNDILVDTTLLLDGAERESTKSSVFYSLLQHYKHHTGTSIPGLYSYSFALDHHTHQPSGHINGSMFNKPILRVTTQSPPLTQTNESQVCIIKSTALDNKPVIVNVAKVNGIAYNQGDTPNLSSKLSPDQVMTVISKSDSNVRKFTYSFRVFTESYNFLRITRGIANVVFSS